MAGTRRLKKSTLRKDFLEELEKDELKKSIDLVELFGYFGVELAKKGNNHAGHCPWHEDRTPSLSVDRAKGLYNCFGCGESGDAFTLVEKMQGMNFKQALTFLKDWPGSIKPIKETIETKTADAPEAKVTKVIATTEAAEAEPATPPTPELGEAAKGEGATSEPVPLQLVSDYYHKKLYEHKEALAYLEQRGIASPELLENFQIGYADGSLKNVISKAQHQALTGQGIFSEKTGREVFTGYITIPLVNQQGQPVSLYGRKITESTYPHLYRKGEHKGIFNRKASKVYDTIIITESIIDALSLITLGLHNTQSLYRTCDLTDEHIQQLKDDRVKTIILALDNDGPGRDATAKHKKRLLQEGFAVKIIYPETNDWNEELTTSNNKEALKKSIEEKISHAEVEKEENSPALEASKEEGYYCFKRGELFYRVSGVKELFVNTLRVTIMSAVSYDTNYEKYYDTIDLYSARNRQSYSQNFSKIYGLEPKQVERDLVAIVEYLEGERERILTQGKAMEIREPTAGERELAMKFLTSPRMFDEIVYDMEKLGYVGEEINKLLMYIVASSIKLDDPISVLIASQSSSGKSALVDTVKKMLPEEYIVEATSLSDQALNYVRDLEHKFLLLSEAVHKDVVEYQLREIQSAQKLTRLVTRKDPKTGEMVTESVSTNAIVSMVMSTTSRKVNPENASRYFVIEADESTEQTRRIHRKQREKYTLARHQEKATTVPEIIKKHQAAQRVLTKRVIVNNLSSYMDFPARLMRTRRDHERFMDLMATICYLRQYQKEEREENHIRYIECDEKDYELAYTIMVNGALASTMSEIPCAVVELYEEMRACAKKKAKEKSLKLIDVTLTQRELREYTGYSQSWIKQNLRVLIEYEYVDVVSGGTARRKGYYRLKEDAPLESYNLEMIPTPEELRKKMQGEKAKERQETKSRTGQTGHKLDILS